LTSVIFDQYAGPAWLTSACGQVQQLRGGRWVTLVSAPHPDPAAPARLLAGIPHVTVASIAGGAPDADPAGAAAAAAAGAGGEGRGAGCVRVVSVSRGGLAPDSEYLFRLAALSDGGLAVGQEVRGGPGPAAVGSARCSW
jgi:hypothetical protein